MIEHLHINCITSPTDFEWLKLLRSNVKDLYEDGFFDADQTEHVEKLPLRSYTAPGEEPEHGEQL